MAPLVLGGIVVLLTGCDRGDGRPQLPTFEDPALQQGRTTWMQVCRNCHLAGVDGAPRVDDAAAWQARAARGVDRLYQSALTGITGEDGKWRMPPRGGNERLSETAVRNAVDYMLAAARAAGERR
jgi:cytochrome c5